MKPEAAQALVKKALESRRGDIVVTIADTAAETGLSLRDAEAALHALVSEYRGHLRVTEDGDILFRFPTRFTKPWETPARLRRVVDAVGGALFGVARFIVRAWVAIVLVGYAVIFAALAIALTLNRSSDDRGSRGGGEIFAFIFRLVAEALFWTYHPFSPFRADAAYGGPSRSWGSSRRRNQTPFYERVDRFFFGPKAPPPDPMASQRAILAEIRAGKGRIGLADVMRVTGLERAEVDPLMSKLMLDYQGSVEVSEEGGIAYRFPELRKTVGINDTKRERPIWEKPVEAPKLTGNEPGSDLLIGGLNAFNLIASGWVLLQGLTIDRLMGIFAGLRPEKLPPPGVPIVLGVIPFVFSIALFLLPLGRLALRSRRKKQAAKERGRRAVMAAVLEGAKSPDGID
ncbi:MAG: hypothetical protein JNK04_19645, partial [Myxococcales bacterium]|nr:hypothetical protein [Myxococcales bacterium]